MGLPLHKAVVVEMPDRARSELWAKVMAAMVDAFEIVLCGPGVTATGSMVRRLRARARERGSVLVQVSAHNPDPCSGPTLSLERGGCGPQGVGGHMGRPRPGVGETVASDPGGAGGGKGPLSRPRRCEVTFGRSGCAEGGSPYAEHAGGDVVDLLTRAG
ncbi:MAG: hypothetical protein M5U19_12075 [Microthrixaceae bacterium]|nr:hypothetical protein [Microthrixaceae bacterium]